MMHSTGRGLAFFLLMGLPLLFGEAGRGQQEEPAPFEIRLPPEIRSEQVQARYFLGGPFGVHGEFVKAETERNTYLIGTSVNHQAAETLKVILYAPGCQFVTIAVPSISQSEKTTDVSCEDLPPITFNGRVELPEPLRSRPYEVEINYMAYWALDFFHTPEGGVTTFHLARVTPDEGGAFQVLLPNFTKDAVTESFHRNAGLQFIARERDTGNIVSFLVPANKEWKNLRDLPVKPKYPTPVLFKPLPESPQKQMIGPKQEDVR
ncbi:MAG: hypothetical protein ABSE93_16750 [Terriglobia bacterium]|jgi:hypothetical protein